MCIHTLYQIILQSVCVHDVGSWPCTRRHVQCNAKSHFCLLCQQVRRAWLESNVVVNGYMRSWPLSIWDMIHTWSHTKRRWGTAPATTTSAASTFKDHGAVQGAATRRSMLHGNTWELQHLLWCAGYFMKTKSDKIIQYPPSYLSRNSYKPKSNLKIEIISTGAVACSGSNGSLSASKVLWLPVATASGYSTSLPLWVSTNLDMYKHIEPHHILSSCSKIFRLTNASSRFSLFFHSFVAMCATQYPFTLRDRFQSQ